MSNQINGSHNELYYSDIENKKLQNKGVLGLLNLVSSHGYVKWLTPL